MTGKEPPGPVEHHLPVTRTARYWTLGGGGAGGAPSEMWFVLHGYKQLARRFIRRFETIANPARTIVAPEALSRFYVSQEPGRHGPRSVVGATWMTREDRAHEIADYVGYLDALAAALEADAHRVTVLGFSQGVATATRWVVQGAVRPARLVVWGEVTPPDLDLERAAGALAGVEVVMVRGDEDRAFAPRLVAEEAARLASAGVAYEVVTYRGGHEIEWEPLERLAER